MSEPPREKLIATIVGRWIEAVIGRRDTRADTPLTDAYRDFGRACLERGLMRREGKRGDSLDEERDPLRLTVARLVREAWAREATVSETLEDLSLLRPVIDRVTVDEARAGTPPAEALRLAAAASSSIDYGVRAIVRALEDHSLRLRREQEETLATMTDILSHELANRLGAARTACEALLGPDLPTPEMLSRGNRLVIASIDDALRTVDDVRALTARQAELAEPDVRRVGLARLIRALIAESQAAVRLDGVELRSDGQLLDVPVDARRLRLILFNLVQNGVKYRDPSRSEPCVTIATGRSGNDVVVHVRDNGLGIAEDALDDIFEPRVRLERDGDVPGSGLGLAVVAEAVAQLGGDIDVTSQVGEGTTFTVRFPVSSAPNTPD